MTNDYKKGNWSYAAFNLGYKLMYGDTKIKKDERIFFSHPKFYFDYTGNKTVTQKSDPVFVLAKIVPLCDSVIALAIESPIP